MTSRYGSKLSGNVVEGRTPFVEGDEEFAKATGVFGNSKRITRKKGDYVEHEYVGGPPCEAMCYVTYNIGGNYAWGNALSGKDFGGTWLDIGEFNDYQSTNKYAGVAQVGARFVVREDGSDPRYEMLDKYVMLTDADRLGDIHTNVTQTDEQIYTQRPFASSSNVVNETEDYELLIDRKQDIIYSFGPFATTMDFYPTGYSRAVGAIPQHFMYGGVRYFAQVHNVLVAYPSGTVYRYPDGIGSALTFDVVICRPLLYLVNEFGDVVNSWYLSDQPFVCLGLIPFNHNATSVQEGSYNIQAAATAGIKSCALGTEYLKCLGGETLIFPYSETIKTYAQFTAQAAAETNPDNRYIYSSLGDYDSAAVIWNYKLGYSTDGLTNLYVSTAALPDYDSCSQPMLYDGTKRHFLGITKCVPASNVGAVYISGSYPTFPMFIPGPMQSAPLFDGTYIFVTTACKTQGTLTHPVYRFNAGTLTILHEFDFGDSALPLAGFRIKNNLFFQFAVATSPYSDPHKLCISQNEGSSWYEVDLPFAGATTGTVSVLYYKGKLVLSIPCYDADTRTFVAYGVWYSQVNIDEFIRVGSIPIDYLFKLNTLYRLEEDDPDPVPAICIGANVIQFSYNGDTNFDLKSYYLDAIQGT